MTKPVYDFLLKFIVIGDSTVGKTTLIHRFTDKRFMKNHDTTIGVEFATKIVSRNKTKYKLQIWDTAGQEAFRSIVRSYYRGTVGCLLVYDITQRHTFESLNFWLQDFQSLVSNVAITLVGNKTDLEESRVVSTEEGKEFAEKYNIGFFETSSKTGCNIDLCFSQLVDNVNKQIENGEITTQKNKDGVQVPYIDKIVSGQWCAC